MNVSSSEDSRIAKSKSSLANSSRMNSSLGFLMTSSEFAFSTFSIINFIWITHRAAELSFDLRNAETRHFRFARGFEFVKRGVGCSPLFVQTLSQVSLFHRLLVLCFEFTIECDVDSNENHRTHRRKGGVNLRTLKKF